MPKAGDGVQEASERRARRSEPPTHMEPTLPGTKDGHALPVIDRDNYTLGREVARGGLGRILEARDRRLDRVVAVKELMQDTAAAKARFDREVLLTARLQHPNIVPIHEAGRWPTGERFYAMKLVRGKTLLRAINEQVDIVGRLTLVPAVLNIADALAYAHSEGIIHRDLKPANVLVGSFGEVLVIDWGLAKFVGQGELEDQEIEIEGDAYTTKTGAVVGTPPYMPPEQARGLKVDESADVYAIGAILYHVIAGRSPFSGDADKDVIKRVLAGPPDSLEHLAPDAPPDLLALVNKAMARDAKDRYPTAREMREELRRYTNGLMVGAYDYGVKEHVERFVRKNFAAVVTAVFATLAVISFATFSVRRMTQERDRAEQSAAAELQARQDAEKRSDELIVTKAESLVRSDPTRAIAWLKRIKNPTQGMSSVTAVAEESGIAERVLRGHVDAITSISVAPNGQNVVSGGADAKVILWDLKTGAPRELDAHTERVTAVNYSPDGRWLASSGYDHKVVVWKVDDFSKRIFEGHHATVRMLAFSPDSRYLVSVGDDDQVILWQVNSGQYRAYHATSDRTAFASFSPDNQHWLTGTHAGGFQLWKVGESDGRTVDVAARKLITATFSPNEQLIATGDADGFITFFHLGTQTSQLPQSDGRVSELQFSPDGRQLAAASSRGVVDLWDIEAQTKRTVAVHAERANTLRFAPRGDLLASGSWDRTVKVTNLRSGYSRTLQGHSDIVSALAFTPDSKKLITASWDKTLRIWPLTLDEPYRVLAGHDVGVHSVAISHSGKLMASGGHDNTVRLWDPNTGQGRVFTGHEDHVYRVVFSPDDQWLASSSDDRTVRLWSLTDERQLVLTGHNADVEEIAFSPAGNILASASEDDTVRLWDLNTNTASVLQHRHDVTALDFDENGQRLATASRAGGIRIWDGVTGQQLQQLEGHNDEVHSVEFSPDDQFLASASSDDSVTVWTLSTGMRHVFKGLIDARKVIWAPDGKSLAVAGAAPRLWICQIGEQTCTPLAGHSALVRDLAFTPDGRALVSAGGDSTIRIWDPKTGESRVLTGHTAPIFDIEIAPDGTWMASASGDRMVRLWPVKLPPAPESILDYLEQLSAEQIREPGASQGN